MSILEDVVTAADDIKDSRDVIVADAGKLHDLVSGPESGQTSIVNLGDVEAPVNVKTPARVIAETEESLLSGLPAGIAFVVDFDDATADGNPGAGKFRLGSATQKDSLVIRINLADAYGDDIADMLGEFTQSDSTVKGHFRLVKLGDRTKWLGFRVTALASESGYVNVTIATVGFSTNNPLAAGDRCLLAFRGTGNRGNDGAGAGDVVSDDDPTTVGNVLVWSTDGKHAAGKAIADLLSGAAFGPWSNVALASTANISNTNTVYVAITAGAGPITSFGSSKDNWLRIVRADVPFTITRDATNLETPNGADCSVVAGDHLIVQRDSSQTAAKTRILAVLKSDGRAYRGPDNVPQNLAYTGIITPAQISSNQNDYAPTGHAAAYTFRLSTDAAREITGLAGGTSGRKVCLQNVGANAIVLKNASASSTEANRFDLGIDVTLAAGKAVVLMYDGTTSRWRPVSLVLPFGALAVLDRVTTIDQNLQLSGDISPSQITGDQNNYSPTGLSTATILRLNSDASRAITGLAGGADGRILGVVNVGNNNIVLKNEDGNSTAGNRFSAGADITIGPGQGVLMIYDSTSSRWRAFFIPGGGGGGGGTTVHGTCNGRLSLTTNVFVMGEAVSGATSVYFVPRAIGDQIGLHDGSSTWTMRSFTEKSVKLTDSQSCTTTNGNATITVADATQLVAGMEVTGTGVQANTVISSITDSTTVVLDKTASASGTNTLTFKCPADTGYDVYGKDVSNALKLFLKARASILTKNTNTFQDGVEVLSGDTTMRWLGAVITSNTAGQADWSLTGQRRRRLHNAYNKQYVIGAEVFGSSGTYYRPLGLVQAVVRIYGASGGGQGAGGGGGTGGTTSFGSLLSVAGSTGGATSTPGTGGAATNADFSIVGASSTNYGGIGLGSCGSPDGGRPNAIDTTNTYGGAAGTFAQRTLAPSSIGASETVTAGAAGTAGSGNGGKDGGPGRVVVEELIEF